MTSWDESLFRAINSLAGHSPFLDQTLTIVGWGSTFYVPMALAAFYWAWRHWREMIIAAPVLAGIVGVADFLGARLKDLVARPRPCTAFPGMTFLEQPCGGQFSFPSNHAMNTAVIASFFQVLYPKSGWVSWPLLIVISFARVYVGAHYVTDVLAGWVLGGLCGVGSAGALLCWSKFRASGRIANPAEGSPPAIR